MLNRQINGWMDGWMDGWMVNGYIGLMASSMGGQMVEQTKNN